MGWNGMGWDGIFVVISLDKGKTKHPPFNTNLVSFHVVDECRHYRSESLRISARRSVQRRPAVLRGGGQLLRNLVPAQIVFNRHYYGPKHVCAAAPGGVHEDTPLAQIPRLQLRHLFM